MGAALTYARRYALFTLVGIAGEDDLDAPDLNGKVGVPAQPARTSDERPPAASAMSATSAALATAPTIAFARKEKAVRPVRTILGPEQSAAVRKRLLADIDQRQSPDKAADKHKAKAVPSNEHLAQTTKASIAFTSATPASRFSTSGGTCPWLGETY